MISKLFLWAGVASLNRHDHARGTLTIRPSARQNVINSSVTETCLTLLSVLTAMLTPCLLNPSQVDLNDGPNLVQLLCREAMILGQCDRLDPKLTDHTLSSDVDVRGLVAVKAVKVKPVRTRDTFDCGHTQRCFHPYRSSKTASKVSFFTGLVLYIVAIS
jgi:hypothetical protein